MAMARASLVRCWCADERRAQGDGRGGVCWVPFRASPLFKVKRKRMVASRWKFRKLRSPVMSVDCCGAPGLQCPPAITGHQLSVAQRPTLLSSPSSFTIIIRFNSFHRSRHVEGFKLSPDSTLAELRLLCWSRSIDPFTPPRPLPNPPPPPPTNLDPHARIARPIRARVRPSNPPNSAGKGPSRSAPRTRMGDPT